VRVYDVLSGSACISLTSDDPVAALHQGTPGQMTYVAGRSTTLAPPCSYCFSSVIVWTGNKNVTISDRFICFILTVKQLTLLAARSLRETTKMRKCIRWPGLRIIDLEVTWFLYCVQVLWRLYLMTCLTTLVTWKWPGCLDVLAPPLWRFVANSTGCWLGRQIFRKHTEQEQSSPRFTRTSFGQNLS